MRPLLAFGARAAIGGGDKAASPFALGPSRVGPKSHVNPGGRVITTVDEVLRWWESGLDASAYVSFRPRHLSISSSSIGVMPPWRYAGLRLHRLIKSTAAKMAKRPRLPKTTERAMARVLLLVSGELVSNVALVVGVGAVEVETTATMASVLLARLGVAARDEGTVGSVAEGEDEAESLSRPDENAANHDELNAARLSSGLIDCDVGVTVGPRVVTGVDDSCESLSDGAGTPESGLVDSSRAETQVISSKNARKNRK